MVVSTLIVIVFVILLRPEDEQPLTGVEGPSGTEQEAGGGEAGDASTGGQRTEGDEERSRRGGTTPGDASGILADAGQGALEPTAPGSGLGGDSDDVGGGSPSDDQYSDAVARLGAALSSGR